MIPYSLPRLTVGINITYKDNIDTFVLNTHYSLYMYLVPLYYIQGIQALLLNSSIWLTEHCGWRHGAGYRVLAHFEDYRVESALINQIVG